MSQPHLEAASAASAAAPVRVLVADGDPGTREYLGTLLRAEAAVDLVGLAATGEEALGEIRRLAPQVVFVGVDLPPPGPSGLEVARAIGPEGMPAVVFVTADDAHAVEAFELAAVDYLVKPFDESRFADAFRRARRRVELEQTEALHAQLLALLARSPVAAPALATPPDVAVLPDEPPAADTSTTDPSGDAGGYLERIAVESTGRVLVVPVAELDYVLASGPYAELHVGDRRHLVRDSMQHLEQRLDPARFVRIHRSIIVRLDLIEALLKGSRGNYAVQLRTGEKLRVGRSRLAQVERKLGVP